MQKTIRQILEGNFDYENGSLEFSCEKIELSLRPGQRQEGAFRIFARPGSAANGSVHSSDWRMECLTEAFSGSDEEIAFCFHGETLEEGDVVKGNFEVVSNQGEYYLPFVATAEHVTVESSVGSIRNLFHFANLAKSNWKEAVKIFYSPDFYRVLSGGDAQYAEDYRALSACGGRDQAMEEFLIRVNKKQQVEYLVDTEAMESEADGQTVTEQELRITRNGWGFTQLTIECRGDFLYTEKECLTDDDFLGNSCRLPVFLDGSRCHHGRNFGQLRLYNCYVSLTVPVVAVWEGGVHGSGELDRQRYLFQLMRHYQSFRLRKIGTSQWLRETGKLVEKMVAMDEEDLAARLFQAQLLITEESYNEAGWILDHVSDMFARQAPAAELLAYYCYLTTLIHGDVDYMGRMTDKVERLYRQDRSNWRVAWLLLYLSEELQKSDRAKWDFLEEMFRAGCRSPVLYIEALFLVNTNPSLLRRLGKFELQVLRYGVKREALKREAAEQLTFLAGKVKEYSETLYRTLAALYLERKDPQLLQEICALLIKGGKAGEAYFAWYKAGVEAQLRITNLYEYYMMSLDPDGQQEIPKQVLLYFSYQSNLDYVRSACLYDYVLQNWDKPGDMQDAYRVKIDYFVRDQIRKGHINRHLANLYAKLLQPDMIDEEASGPLSELLFAHMIQTEDPSLRKVYVYQPGNQQPMEYSLSEGRAWVPLYGSRYTVVFEDAGKNRFLKSKEYTIEKLMLPGKYLRWLLPHVDSNLGLDLYLCEGESAYLEGPEESLKRELRVAASGYVDSQVKARLYLHILRHYYEADDMRALDDYLKQVPAEELTAGQRGEVLELMVLRGCHGQAGEWLEKYGPYFVDAKILLRLTSAVIQKNDMAESRALTAAAVHAFRRGKYDSTVLEYLIQYYQGMAKSMRDIWKAARDFDVDCTRLSERILMQMLYSGAFVGEKMEIFRYYISRGARAEVEEAFLAQCAYDYFVRERVTEQEVFREIKGMYLQGEEIQRVCKLAYLKYYAENREELDEEALAVSGQFLQEMAEEGIRLEFFRKYKECRSLQLEMADKTILEYRTRPRSKVCIHYTVLGEGDEADGYHTEYMQEAYGGVFFKEFVLFFGETLQYYIMEERDGDERPTVSGTLQRSDNAEQEDSRYRLINDIVISKALQDYETLDNLLEEYYRKDYLGGRMFGLQ